MRVVRERLVLTLVATLVAAAVIVPVGGARPQGRATVAVYPTLYVNYTDNCTFSIVNDVGSPVSSIPPGTYQVQVNTPIMFKILASQGIPSGSMEACGIGWVEFQLTGPGVSLYTTLTVGCDSSDTLPAVYFPPNSTFVAQDNAQPSVTHTTITTTGSGAPVDPTSSSANAPSTSTATGGRLSAIGTPISGAGGSLAALGGTVKANGSLTLILKGKPVATLTAGRYSITVADKSRKSGFYVAKAGHAATAVTGTSFVGTRTVTITLTAGQWFFAPTPGGKKTYFFVTG
jgi:hypothetical protein